MPRVAQGHRRMIENRRQLRLDSRAEEVERRRFERRRNHLNHGLMDLKSARRLRLSDYVSRDGEHRLGGEQVEPRHNLGILNDDLRQPLGVAQDEEADVTQPAQAMQPARQPHALANVPANLGCPDAFHGDTPHTKAAPSPCGRGDPVVPPHFAASVKDDGLEGPANGGKPARIPGLPRSFPRSEVSSQGPEVALQPARLSGLRETCYCSPSSLCMR